MATIDVGTVVQRCIDQQRPLADRQEVSLTIEPSQVASTVWADSDGLFTMLTNLLSNAVKYTPRSGRVTVRWYRREEDTVIEVQDTGIGIAPAEQQRVFERFYRVDRARSREFGGTGLGLAIVKHLAQSFGGSVGLESELQRGSTFRVVLPVSKR
jgi:signal transduction histidine kinase